MSNETKHSPGCRMTFGRKDATCVRCRELLAGAKPRQWARVTQARQLAEIRQHDCRISGCGPVCTFGEW